MSRGGKRSLKRAKPSVGRLRNYMKGRNTLRHLPEAFLCSRCAYAVVLFSLLCVGLDGQNGVVKGF